ncbi:MAG: DNA mismatch repair endonuclease MutL [Verrucomicrobia bacterium]|nr:DNA mismatch repair endonuclease MutL [Verrucomicrobiota bacterium]MBU1734845.1 DNA mismatch repair endonuclease MutL [Verrucomicrobiota bacterium]MBU1857493.1 DNA mismatch repair endonuclease MutL [Verrucomicrobiota bacterium]
MSADHSIHVLSDVVANKIAAGEVVERPASVLKELVENALDAEATQIDVAIVCGGRTLVGVDDNGRGMNRDDALLAVERHATSKIRDVDDLERIATLGFRGEALAAITSVARFRLCTRRAADLTGTELLMAAGKIQEVRDAGCPPGTSVEVRHLFFNVPARRKFLRSEQTELVHLRQVFMTYGLAHPAVGMKLTVDGRMVFSLAPGATFEDRRRDLFSFLSPSDLRPVNHAVGGIRVTGHVGLPAVSRSDRAEQYIFINGRPAGAPIVSGAIREGYRAVLPRDRYPVVFLFLELDPSLVDVNVHPTKREVRFYNPGAVREAVTAAVRQALAPDGVGAFVPQSVRPLAPSAGGLPACPSSAREFGQGFLGRDVPRDWHPPLKGLEPFSGAPGVPGERRFPYPARPMPPLDAQTRDQPVRHSLGEGGRSGESEISNTSAPWTWCRILGQIGGLYVVMETEDGLALMDPHAAHERILYERFMAQVTRGRIESQGLLVPETVDLPPRDALRVRRHLDLLKKMGFSIAEFGGDTFVVDALPLCFQSTTSRALLTDMAAILETAGERRSADNLLEEQVAQAACKAAVKAHSVLTREEIEDLVMQLAKTEMPYTCPHGRPTLIHTSFQELAKKFGRE